MELENMKIGEEQPPLEAKKVKIVSYKPEEVTNKDGKEVGTKLILNVTHPDSEKELQISAIKFERDSKLKEFGLWVSEDKDGNIPHHSSLAYLLRTCKVGTVPEIVNKEVETVTGDRGYLVVKGY